MQIKSKSKLLITLENVNKVFMSFLPASRVSRPAACWPSQWHDNCMNGLARKVHNFTPNSRTRWAQCSRAVWCRSSSHSLPPAGPSTFVGAMWQVKGAIARLLPVDNPTPPALGRPSHSPWCRFGSSSCGSLRSTPKCAKLRVGLRQSAASVRVHSVVVALKLFDGYS